MLDTKLIHKEINLVIEKLKTRHVKPELLQNLSVIIQNRNHLLTQLAHQNAQKNLISKQLGSATNRDDLLKQAALIKLEIRHLEQQLKNYQDDLDRLLPTLPNLPLDGIPEGTDETGNVIVSKYEQLGRGLVENVLPHYEIATSKKLADFARAAKISGSRFVFYQHQGAKLVRALVNFMLDLHTTNGYVEMVPPLLVNSQTMYGTGQLPKFADDLFQIQAEDLWLIPTAEVPLTNYYQNEILDLTKPIKLTAYTPCFRSEAGAAGRDTKGLIRSRQFHKVELVKITTASQALSEFENCVADAERVLQLLEIPYQKVLLCTGDLGFSARITYDLELWLPSERRFREVSSISYFGDFQARRAKIRYRNEQGKTTYAHTINGSGLAIDRIVAALLELYQNSDGTIDIPKALLPFWHGDQSF